MSNLHPDSASPNSGVSMTEEEYLSDYKLIYDDIHGAINFFHTYIEIHKFASEDSDIYNAINTSASFWNTQLYSLQLTFFIVLARIFDEGNGHSVHKLLKTTVTHPEYFSKSALYERKKMPAGQPQPDWLDDYVNKAWEPTASDLRAIKKNLGPYKTKFEKLYRPIRHKIFAHKALKDMEQISNLIGMAVHEEVDNLLYFLFHLMETIGQIFHNGRQPESDSHVAYGRHKDRIKTTTRDVLRTLAKGTVGSSEKPA